jgi:hypothetical protein
MGERRDTQEGGFTEGNGERLQSKRWGQKDNAELILNR